jgi:plasmid stabilization system protein ParE
MTGRINYTPEAEQQLDELDDWITKAASAEIAQQFVSAILDHSDGILVFPLAGRACDEVRPGMRTTTCKPPRWPGLGGRAQRRPGRSGGGLMTRSCVANAWQEDQRRPSVANARQRVCADQRHNANDDREQPLSVPRFPRYY